jgi:hypothetical protein
MSALSMMVPEVLRNSIEKSAAASPFRSASTIIPSAKDLARNSPAVPLEASVSMRPALYPIALDTAASVRPRAAQSLYMSAQVGPKSGVSAYLPGEHPPPPDTAWISSALSARISFFISRSRNFVLGGPSAIRHGDLSRIAVFDDVMAITELSIAALSVRPKSC